MRTIVVAAIAVLLAGISVAAATGPATSADPPRPTGAVVLTVAGDLAHANRSPFDPVRDVFFAYHEQEFDRAVEFDLATLDRLGTREIVIAYEGWPEPIHFSGPRLADVLEAAGCAAGAAVTTLALDGFATEIPAAEVGAHDWVLATRADGKRHAIGGRGPLWLVFDPPGDRPATEDEELMWPWALFSIRCGGGG